MKKYQILIYILILFTLLFILTGCANNENKENTAITNNVVGSRTSVNVNEEIAENRISNILQNQNETIQNISSETEISSYATNILDEEAGRLTNISITCSTLNNTIVKPGETFSFNETVGQPSAQRGYQEATIIVNHKKERGIGRRKLSSKFYFI